ncbi:MAG: hypothetical protein ABSA52_19725 [Candidatus Binatia bacterium]|jgi:hypothetical protein
MRRTTRAAPDEHADAREFIERWAKAGPALEGQRYRELQELDDERARRMTLDLFKRWRPEPWMRRAEDWWRRRKSFSSLRAEKARRSRGDERATFPLPSEPALR